MVDSVCLLISARAKMFLWIWNKWSQMITKRHNEGSLLFKDCSTFLWHSEWIESLNIHYRIMFNNEMDAPQTTIAYLNVAKMLRLHFIAEFLSNPIWTDLLPVVTVIAIQIKHAILLKYQLKSLEFYCNTLH